MKNFTEKVITVLAAVLPGICGLSEQAAAQTCNPVAIPYLEDFNSVTVPALPACTQADDLDGDGVTWETMTWMGNALNIDYQDGGSDDWFYTEGMQLHADTIYVLQFGYTGWAAKGGKGEGTASMDVFMGAARNADSMHAAPALFENIDFVLNLNELDTVTIYFKPSRSGVWYAGFHSKMEGRSSIRLDDISVTKAYSNYWKDVRLAAVVDPVAGSELCPDNNADVRVAVANTGIDTLTDIPVYLSAAGNTLTDTVRRPLAPGTTDTVTFSGADLSGTGTVTLTAYAGFSGDEFAGNDSLSWHITVVLPPSADSLTAAAEGGLTYRFAAPGATDVTTWEWDFGDGNTGSGNNPVHTYASEGFYAVGLKGINGCDWDTVSHVFEILDVPTGIQETPAAAGWTIYPNPAREKITISHAGNMPIDGIVVCNSVGSVVYRSGPVSATRQEILTGGWAAGVYLVRIRTAGADVIRRLELVP